MQWEKGKEQENPYDKKKILQRNAQAEEETWEKESKTRRKYPELFQNAQNLF